MPFPYESDPSTYTPTYGPSGPPEVYPWAPAPSGVQKAGFSISSIENEQRDWLPGNWGAGGGGGTGGGGGGSSGPGYADGTPLNIYSGPGGSVSGPGQDAPSPAGRYPGYWAGVQEALYAWAMPGSAAVAHAATSAAAYAFAVVGAAAGVSPAKAGPYFGRGKLPPFSLDYGGGAPIGEFGEGSPVPQDMFATDSNSAGSGRGEPVTKADLAAESWNADEIAIPGMGRNWQVKLWDEIARDPRLFYPRVVEDFFNVNTYQAEGLDPFYTYSGLPTFAVYEQMFGPGTPPLYMGTRALILSPEFGDMFEWGPIVKPRY
jgi:hypothetical protein